MTAYPTDPKRTYAMVVGVENYNAGTKWSLDGPASDARRFVDWLQKQHVPDHNIMLFLSCLEENKGLKDKPGPSVQPATREEIYKCITEVLPGKSCDLFYFFWVGHGIITVDGTRRLFYADATQANKLNLDLDSLITSLRTSYFQHLPRQVLIIDACANYVEELRLPVTLPKEEFPVGQPKSGHEQFILLGARAGEVAKNIASRKTDLFSEEILRALNEQLEIQGHPNMRKVRDQIVDRFSALRASGQANQTPIYFWYRDWDTSEGSFSQARTSSNNRTQLSQEPARSLSFPEEKEIVNKMLASLTMRERNRRDTVVSCLRLEIANSIARNDATNIDVFNILKACLNYSGGLRELVEIIQFFEGDTIPFRALQAEVDQVLPDYPAVLTREMIAKALEIIPPKLAVSESWKRLYASSFPRGYNNRPEAKNLEEALRNLSKIIIEKEGFPYPVIEFIEQLASQAQSSDVADRIKVWVDPIICGLNLSQEDLDTLRAEIRAAKSAAQKALPYLLIEVKKAPSANHQETSYNLQSWLWRDSEDIEFLGLQESLDMATVKQVVYEQVATVSEELDEELIVEFFLPRDLLHWDVDQWEGVMRAYVRSKLGFECQVYVRSIDRALNRKIRRFWRQKWQQLQEEQALGSSSNSPFLLVCNEVGYDYQSLLVKLNSRHVVCLALTFVPPEIPDREKGDILYTSFDAGMPIALWLRQPPDNLEEIQREINKLLSGRVLKELPIVVKEERSKAISEPQGTHFGKWLTLLYDNPERLPPYAVQFEVPRKERNIS